MAYKMKGHTLPGIKQRGYESKINQGKPGAPNLDNVVKELNNASKMHKKQAGVVERHIESMEKPGPPSNPLFGKNKGFKTRDNIFKKFGRFVKRIVKPKRSLSYKGTSMSTKGK